MNTAEQNTAKETFTQYVIDFIDTEIENFAGITVYACDLASELTQGINCDGTATYSTYEAKEYLKHWWDEASDYFKYEKDNFGENIHNPFERPEAFMVCMIIQGVSYILAEISVIDDNWNEEITLTPKVILEIKEFLKEYSNEITF